MKYPLVLAGLVLLAVVHGCGVGVTKEVEAAELSGSPNLLRLDAVSSVPALQMIANSVEAIGVVGEPVNIQLRASGGHGPYTWMVSSGSLPSGVSLSNNGMVTGSFAAAGTWVSTVEAKDSSHPTRTARQAVLVKVKAAPLTITATGLSAGQSGSGYTARLRATGGTPQYSWSLASGSLPRGLSLSGDGVISGTPSDASVQAFTVGVRDSGSPTQQKLRAMLLQISNPPLIITSTSIGSAQTGSNYSATLRAKGGDGHYTWYLASGKLPTGLRLSNAGVISGTPTTAGSSAFNVGVQDTERKMQRTTVSLSLVVAAAARPLQITTNSLGGATAGSSYNSTLSASGGTPAYSWFLAAGSLPGGLTLSNSGVISGTPTTTGTYAFVAAVSDQEASTRRISKALSITVSAAPLTITTGSLSSGQSSSAYAAQLSATGGVPAYRWTVTAGSLPAGLSLNASTGIISGTPTTSGTSIFMYAVTDSELKQQTASAKASITIDTATVSSGGTTWFIRTDGGSRYAASSNPEGQCDGTSDTAYPGAGVNQHCAFNDVRWMLWDNTYGKWQWVMQGGDTLVIRGCAASAFQQNADAPHCRIGWDKATGNDAQNTWCWGASACNILPPPSGTPARHTRILGGCAFGNYSCNPVSSYPYTGNNLTQIFGGFTPTVLLMLNGSKYIDLEGLEFTTHNGQCARYGTTHPLPGCNRGSSYPLSDQADQAISTDNTTSNILLQDVYVHGFSSNGIGGPVGGPITLTRVSIDFNAFAGWNFDDGSSTPNAPDATITQSYVSMVGNGCQEEYPITHTQFPARGCWDTTSGGFGDSWSGQNSMLSSFTCDHCNISYNTKDGGLGPHTVVHNLVLTNSTWIANMGQSGKWGQDANSTFLFRNNVLVGNCMRMSQQLPGAAQNFDAGTNATGSGLSGYCRAAGSLFDYYADAGSTVNFVNNTVITYQPTLFEVGCREPNVCGTAPYNFTNNLILGYTSAYSMSPFNPGQKPGLYYKDDNSAAIVGRNNLEFGVKNGDGCSSNGTLCSDPMFVNEPSSFTTVESVLDGYDFHLASGSPASQAGILNALTPVLDLYGTQQSSPATVGAVAH